MNIPNAINPARVRSVLSLFDKEGLHTDEAFALSRSAVIALTPLVKEVLQNDFPIRDIIHVLHLAVTDIELDVILGIPLLSTGQTQVET